MLMNDLIAFDFDSSNIRVVTDDRGTPWFVGKDVAHALGYANPSDAMKQHCKGVAKRYPPFRPPGACRRSASSRRPMSCA